MKKHIIGVVIMGMLLPVNGLKAMKDNRNPLRRWSDRVGLTTATNRSDRLRDRFSRGKEKGRQWAADHRVTESTTSDHLRRGMKDAGKGAQQVGAVLDQGTGDLVASLTGAVTTLTEGAKKAIRKAKNWVLDHVNYISIENKLQREIDKGTDPQTVLDEIKAVRETANAGRARLKGKIHTTGTIEQGRELEFSSKTILTLNRKLKDLEEQAEEKIGQEEAQTTEAHEHADIRGTQRRVGSAEVRTRGETETDTSRGRQPRESAKRRGEKYGIGEAPKKPSRLDRIRKHIGLETEESRERIERHEQYEAAQAREKARQDRIRERNESSEHGE